MVRYKSRIGPGGSVKPRVKATRKKRSKELPQSPLEEDGGRLRVDATDNPVAPGGSLSSGGALGSGGALSTGGVISQEQAENMTYPQVYHTLGHMTGGEFHTLQGLAAAHLPDQGHPMKRPIMQSLGGAFIHPRTISKVATMDVLKAPSPQMLSRALYQEYLDSLSGKEVGGGLFKSIKNLLKRGLKGAAKGARGALKVGKTVNNAIKRGTEVAKTFQEPLSAFAPGLGEILQKGIGTAEAVQGGLETGLSAGEQISAGITELEQAVAQAEAGQ